MKHYTITLKHNNIIAECDTIWYAIGFIGDAMRKRAKTENVYVPVFPIYGQLTKNGYYADDFCTIESV